jgi:hypothetical protein
VLLLADDRHPGNAGLPKSPSVIVSAVLTPEDRGLDLDDPTHLAIAYQTDAGPETARIAWDAVFLVAGQSAVDVQANRLSTHVSASPPDFLQPDVDANLRRLLAATDMGPPPPLEWKLDVSPQLLADDADRSGWCPDKRAAIERILAHGQAPAILWFDPDAPGVQLPAVFRSTGRCEVHVGQAAGSQDVQLRATVLSWQMATPQGMQRITLPWKAIAAFRDTGNGHGWWWPRDLAAKPRHDLQRNAELWSVLQRLEGIPLALPTPFQILALQPPTLKDKSAALRRLMRLGLAIVLADAHHPGLRLPPSLPGRARVLLVPIGLQNLAANVRVDGEGVAVQMPDYEGQVVDIWLPWTAVFSMASGQTGVPNAWPEDYPPFLTDALNAMHSINRSDGGPLPAELDVFDHEPSGDGLGLGLTKAADGGMSLVVGRPLGIMPPPSGSPLGFKHRAVMQFAFRLPRPSLQ